MSVLRVMSGAVQAAASPAWDPSMLTGAQAWWDTVLSDVTYSSGSLISQIDDLIGTNHLGQSNPSNQPDDGIRTINSLAAMDFDGTANINLSGAVGVTNILYAWFVIKFDALVDHDVINDSGPFTDTQATNDGWAFKLDQSAGDSGQLELGVSNGSGRDALRTTGAVAVGTSGPHFLECWANGSTAIGIAVDGTEETNSSLTYGFSGPDTLNFMARAGITNGLDGALCAMGICNQIPDGTERGLLRTYNQNRWNTP